MKLKQLIFIFTFYVTLTHAQKEANIWMFNYNGLNFNTGVYPPVLLSNSLSSSGLCASICNKTSGSLLFSADGRTIRNANDQFMDSIVYTVGGGSGTKSSIIVPQMNNDSLYYVFTVQREPTRGIRYSVVNMNLNNGLGGVDPMHRNLLLDSGYTAIIYLAGVKHSNGCDVWIVTHENSTDTFRAYLVSAAGISNPVISQIGTIYTSLFAVTTYKFSPDGKKLACCGGDGISMEVFDFERTTGVLTNPMYFPVTKPGGISFSADNSKLYFNDWTTGDIFQYDMNAGTYNDILNSKKTINPGFQINYQGIRMQLAPDKRIYLSYQTRYKISVINHPNDSGLACGFQDSIIGLSQNTNESFPNFIESYFYTPAVKITNDSTGCAGDTLHFAVDSVDGATNYVWSFGDSAVMQGQVIAHVYPVAGNYQVTLSVLFNCNAPVTVQKNIVINSKPSIYLPPDTALCLNQKLLLQSNAVNADGYMWSTGESTSSIEINNYGHYTVTAFNSCGTTQSSIEVKEGNGPLILTNQNVITPNDDGKNDWFAPAPDENVVGMSIYNRWGKKVFESSGQNKKWNGKNSSGESVEGIYYFIATVSGCNSNAEVINGTVTVLK